jgi:tRNA1Val (adenine37-N6)-methyltransferase
MKVTTDGCLFGAIAAKELADLPQGKILDIGAGTGLLSLMVAQENAAVQLDAVEIDEAAAEQAGENIAASPWSNRVHVVQRDVLEYQPLHLYDAIISNPPFYEQQLASPKKERQLAHHSSGLTLEQLVEQVTKWLKPDGRFYVLLPFYRTAESIAFAEQVGLFPQQEWRVKQTPKHPYFRTILCLGFQKNITLETIELTIKNEQDQYTPAFTSLLSPYYLKL